jgi:hypothetical protein
LRIPCCGVAEVGNILEIRWENHNYVNACKHRYRANRIVSSQQYISKHPVLLVWKLLQNYGGCELMA